MENVFISEQEKADFELFSSDASSVRELKSLVYNRARALEVDKTVLIVCYSDLLAALIFNQSDKVLIDAVTNFISFQERLFNTRFILRTKLFCFSDRMSTRHIEAEMSAEGYRPATLSELIAFDMKKPIVSENFPIVSLIPSDDSDFSEGEECVLVPILDGKSEDAITWGSYFQGWTENYCRFLGVRI